MTDKVTFTKTDCGCIRKEIMTNAEFIKRFGDCEHIKECPECGADMYQEEVLVAKTTQADLDDSFEKMWVCEECGYTQ
jgi:hypothetical protein